MRITRKIVEARFQSAAKFLGWNTTAYKEGKAQVGAIMLDYAACYGGYRLSVMHNEQGAENFFLGRTERLSGPEMLQYLAGLEDGAALERRRIMTAPYGATRPQVEVA